MHSKWTHRIHVASAIRINYAVLLIILLRFLKSFKTSFHPRSSHRKVHMQDFSKTDVSIKQTNHSVNFLDQWNWNIFIKLSIKLFNFNTLSRTYIIESLASPILKKKMSFGSIPTNLIFLPHFSLLQGTF